MQNRQKLKGEFTMKDSKMNKNLLLDIITETKENADEVCNSSEKTDYEQGQLLAYATVLSIIRDVLSGYDLKEYGLDFDIDKKYLLG